MFLISYGVTWQVFGLSPRAVPGGRSCSSPAEGMLCSQGQGQQCHGTAACTSWSPQLIVGCAKEGRVPKTKERHFPGLQEAAKSLVLAVLIFLRLNPLYALSTLSVKGLKELSLH